MNILKLVFEASLVVKIILLILLLFSVFSWAIIFFKRKMFKATSVQTQRFLEVFRKSRNLTEVSEASKRFKSSSLAIIFQSGFKEMAHMAKSNPGSSLSPTKLDNLNRALVKASNSEIARLEKMLPFLATTGSVTPFIGLFGTVWGIMDAFMRIGVTRSASLVSVAPGIAEALIATALGLFAAIPAVIAYNYFLHRIKDQITQMEDFSMELLTIAERLYASS
ncbi:MAG: protein TolQ [Candidatus Aminicenantales bacterium]